MTEKERKEHERLQDLWATGDATKKQILRCMELDTKATAERKAKNPGRD